VISHDHGMTGYPLPPGEGRLFVNGVYRPAAGGHTYRDVNPADGTLICDVASATARDIHSAVAAARHAFENGIWSMLPGKQRGSVLFRIAQTIRDNADWLAYIEAIDTGKPIRYAREFDIPAAADLFTYYGGMAEQIEGSVREAGHSALAYTRKEPIGVIAAVVSYSFPLNLAVNKIAPALAAGNTIVLKPAKPAPLISLWLAHALAETGMPPGVFNVVTGRDDLALVLARHPDVGKVALSGTTPDGREIAAASAASMKRLTLNLDGKGALIILADADLDAAARTAIQAAFYNAGQLFMNGSRLLVEQSIYPEMLKRIESLATRLRVGNPLDPRTDVGPLISEAQVRKVADFVAAGRKEGARVLTGGASGKASGNGHRGYFWMPTIFADVKSDMSIAREPVLGPVLTVTPFARVDEAISIANDTIYGLASGVYTADLALAHRIAEKLRVGIVWVNGWGRFGNGTTYGGTRASGYGRELGPEGLQEYLQTKSVCIDLG
jgi:acyl-CoA reductase-like NAD-dependent aldehyde dehydrogenase